MLGFPILYCKGMRPMMFQLSGFCYRSPKSGNPIASILKRNVWGFPALFVLNPVSNFLGCTINPKPFTLNP